MYMGKPGLIDVTFQNLLQLIIESIFRPHPFRGIIIFNPIRNQSLEQ